MALQKRNAFDFLVENQFSLFKQSKASPKNLQRDGWGIGSLENAARSGLARDRRPWKVTRSEKPIFNQEKQFARIAQSRRSGIILTHIRHASNPKNLPQTQLARRENSQPFADRNLIFEHNGTLNIPDEVARTLGRYQKLVAGTNDSEVLFWLFVKTWDELHPQAEPSQIWKETFGGMIDHIRSVWKSASHFKKKFSQPYRGLNFIASDGRTLAALSWYDRAEGKSLCGQGRPYFEMCYKNLPDRIAIASEPMDSSNDWKVIPNRHLLIVGKKGGRLVPETISLQAH